MRSAKTWLATRMSPRQRTFLSLGLALTGLMLVVFATSGGILLNGFLAAERAKVRRDAERAQAALAGDLADLNRTASGLANAAGTAAFIAAPNDAYVQNNLTAQRLAGLQLNLVVFVNPAGQGVYLKHAASNTGAELAVPESLKAQLVPGSPLVAAAQAQGRRLGYLLLPAAPMLLVARPVPGLGGQSPAAGTLLVGRYLDDAEIQRLGQTTQLTLTLYRLDGPLPPEAQAARAAFQPGQPLPLYPQGLQAIAAYLPLTGLNDQPALLLQVAEDRSLFWQGLASLLLFHSTLLAVSLAFGSAIWILLRRLNRLAQSESEARYRAIIEQTSEGILLVALSSRQVLESNAAAQRLLGYTAADLRCLTLYDLTAAAHASVDQALEHVADAALEARRAFTAELSYRRKDGALVEAEVEIVLIRYAGRAQLCVTLRDIAERKQREREMSAMLSLSEALRTAPTPAAIYPRLLEQTGKLLNVEEAALALHEPATEEIVVVAARGAWTSQTGERLIFGQGLCGLVVATGQPYLENDLTGDPTSLAAESMPLSNGQYSHLQSVACAPLAARGETLGALMVGSVFAFSEAQTRLLGLICDLAANALRRARLHEQTELRVRRLGALRLVEAAINTSPDLRGVFDLLLNQVASADGADAAAVFLLNPQFQTLEYFAGRGFSTEAVRRLHLRPNQLDDFPPLAGEDLAAHFALPFIARGQLKGALQVFYRATPRPNPEWQTFLETLAEQAALAIVNHTRFENLQLSNRELHDAYDRTLEGWSGALELRALESAGHAQRVVAITLRLAAHLGLDGAELEHIRRGALLHDIGKIGIPDQILLKPATLTAEERAIVNQHTDYARQLLEPIAFLRPALAIPYSHHERWDGAGYPLGLKGEAIPLAARIFAVVDVWDALRSERPYRGPLSIAEALAYLRQEAGHQFDPRVVEAFLQIAEVDAARLELGSSL